MSWPPSKSIINFTYTENNNHKKTDRNFSTDVEDHKHLYHFCDDPTWAARNPIPTPSGGTKVELASLPGYSANLSELYISNDSAQRESALKVGNLIIHHFKEQTLAISTLEEFSILMWVVKRNESQYSASALSNPKNLSPLASFGACCPLQGEHSTNNPQVSCWPALVNKKLWKQLYALAKRCYLVIDERFLSYLNSKNECIFTKKDVLFVLADCNKHWRSVLTTNFDDYHERCLHLERCFNLVLRWARCFGLFSKYPTTLFRNKHWMVQYNWITDKQHDKLLQQYNEDPRNSSGAILDLTEDTGHCQAGFGRGQGAYYSTAEFIPFGAAGPAYCQVLSPQARLPQQGGAAGPAYFQPPFPQQGGAAGPASLSQQGGAAGPARPPPQGGAAFPARPPPQGNALVPPSPLPHGGIAGPNFYYPNYGFGPHVPFPYPVYNGNPIMGAAGGKPAASVAESKISQQEKIDRIHQTDDYYKTEKGKAELRKQREGFFKHFTCPECQNDIRVECRKCSIVASFTDLQGYSNMKPTSDSQPSKNQANINVKGRDAVKLSTEQAGSASKSIAQKRKKDDNSKTKKPASKKRKADSESEETSDDFCAKSFDDALDYEDECESPEKKKPSEKSKRSAEDDSDEDEGKDLDGKTYGNADSCFCSRRCVCDHYHRFYQNYHADYCEGGCVCPCLCKKGRTCICAYSTESGGKVSGKKAKKFHKLPDNLPPDYSLGGPIVDAAVPDRAPVSAAAVKKPAPVSAAAVPDTAPVSAAAVPDLAPAVPDPAPVVPDLAPVSAPAAAGKLPLGAEDNSDCICNATCCCFIFFEDFQDTDTCFCLRSCICNIPRSQGGKALPQDL